MKNTCFLFSLLLLLSCSQQRERYVCTCAQKLKVSEFLTQNIKAANNMSDEEMEDVITELTWQAIRLHCNQKPIWIDHNGNIDFDKQKLDSCESVMTYHY